ncbi:MAG: LacI family DNA-binding transcriptional regulator [Sedimentisphaerales bacterium]|nr:LacI family DNA-binding transcriptional regulator [Sedimentisphaerales bacterium]
MPEQLANLNDVASRAGVSKSTVSRVLNNKLGNGFTVREEVRNRILAVARELNYRPNLIAQSLTKQRYRMIVILGGAHALSEMGNIYQTAVNTITQSLDSDPEDFDVSVDVSHHKSDISELPPWKIEGVIVLAKSTPATMKELEDAAIPYVVINGPAGKGGISVVPDDVQGTRLAVTYFYELGHRKIAYAGPRADYLRGHSSLADRHQTYISMLKEFDLPDIPEHNMPFDSAEEFLRSAVLNHGATAIVAYGHREGLNLMQAAHKLDIAIPEQLSLLCFCDKYANSIMSPGLTFIDLRSQEMGKVAAELLLKRMTDKKYRPKTVKVDERLVIRESTAPPPKD